LEKQADMRDIMKILQQAQEMQGRMAKIQEELQAMTLTGTAGGGMVTVDVNGQGIVKRVKIDPSVVNSSDTEMLEDLVTVAVADAQRKAQERQQEQMSALTGGMNLPFKLPFG
jgi:DNA-binding YbaB/EbfC family protein